MPSKSRQHTDYQSAVSKLLSLADFERKSRANDPPDFHLKRIERLLSYLGNPHHGQKYVHVAGSKGKGSTSAMIAWALAANGYKTGLFTSPSIHRITERIRVNGDPISESDFTDLVNDLWHAVEKVTVDGDIGVVSVFELETAMAFCHFTNSNVDMSVIEVGLGGRLDSTNIITPLVSVITPVSLDHVAVLGDTVELIAREKAGIIKQGVPVVTAPQYPDALRVIAAKASEQGSELIESSTVVTITKEKNLGLDGTNLEIKTRNSIFSPHLRLLGRHQIENATTAIAAICVLEKTGIRIDPTKISSGIENVQWPARNQIVTTEPIPIFVDGAHNVDSARALRKSVEALFPHSKNIFVILGTVRGHDPAAVARELQPFKPIFITTESRHPKSLTNLELSKLLGECKIGVHQSTSNTSDALNVAKNLANENDLILGTGSLFVAAEIVEIEHKIEPELYADIKLPRRP
ncbi:MAG: bifunctional folylpolyglutamate synthase/dihydrofolate synthase [Chloroflexi bacterium]|jgi:dihydrofolate synthase/folylpolyglutamate synthase|nr:bifunctional folylpolyglutamate synthase/dihydrofolate synthase [Chloroflexota bacterium]MBT4143022.1 bifunctional folylpolyglutamate synthase/dihydrofolate synthase [Chloroflexota bacterium]MBT5893542.1 bifunctional folylpolyglutamate synthase/dihydrofolate synthase [Chloroflexota bacterium]MBT6707163.1 bifunctional folylpolyglutamate synthase/dihydrofolate synthase [Chloroflexota bacterium]MBT7079745.1 bifunctional folylpolyglutamate synthase/dihydrofolate synthase [Chloroflexota bacterium